ncbi:unnamed protein product [Dovyalis caffra]|uniref:Uncharacterized protein n=1 Tax=Dovyalis caffra TaxID=77055 RepID=A0AAV1SR47_9ROSI|nr:unnamed protein product [Dovyalis caffra]
MLPVKKIGGAVGDVMYVKVRFLFEMQLVNEREGEEELKKRMKRISTAIFMSDQFIVTAENAKGRRNSRNLQLYAHVKFQGFRLPTIIDFPSHRFYSRVVHALICAERTRYIVRRKKVISATRHDACLKKTDQSREVLPVGVRLSKVTEREEKEERE